MKKLAIYYGERNLIVFEIKNGETINFDDISPDIEPKKCLLYLEAKGLGIKALATIKDTIKSKTKRIFDEKKEKCIAYELEEIDYVGLKNEFELKKKFIICGNETPKERK